MIENLPNLFNKFQYHWLPMFLSTILILIDSWLIVLDVIGFDFGLNRFYFSSKVITKIAFLIF
jgi:hypothetical protein